VRLDLARPLAQLLGRAGGLARLGGARFDCGKRLPDLGGA
jgi:hypothetical protein